MPGRHHPCCPGHRHQHHTINGVDQLTFRMPMRSHDVAVSVVAGKCRQGGMGIHLRRAPERPAIRVR